MGQACSTTPKPKKQTPQNSPPGQQVIKPFNIENKSAVIQFNYALDNPQNTNGKDKQNNNNNFFMTSNASLPSMIKSKKIRLDSNSQGETCCFITNENIRDVYGITENLLGKGSFGSVKEAYLLANPQKRFAVKSISKTSEAAEGGSFEWLYREVRISKQLDHPNIAKLYETYQDSKHFYLVLEICNGGQLLQRVLNEGRLTEQQASEVIGQMLSAVKYLHSLDIVHRDLKPENFLFSDDRSEVKMIDFGLSKQYSAQQQMLNMDSQQIMKQMSTPYSANNKIQTIVGTVQYIAPEVLTGKYDFKCDIWSLGVILYCLLSGEFPFSGNNEADIFEKINRGTFSFKEEYHLSKQSRDLISKLMCVDPKKRITIPEALKHPWFKLQSSTPLHSNNGKPIQIKFIKNLETYPTKTSQLQKLFLHLAFKATAQQQFIQQFTKVFRSIDLNNQGFLTAESLHKSMHNLGCTESLQEVSQLVREISSSCFSNKCEVRTHAEEFIEFSLFLEANMDRSVLQSEDIQRKVFNLLDTKKKGTVGMEEITICLQREGYTFASTKDFINSLLEGNLQQQQNENNSIIRKEENGENNGQSQNGISISFEEFQKMVSQQYTTLNAINQMNKMSPENNQNGIPGGSYLIGNYKGGRGSSGSGVK